MNLNKICETLSEIQVNNQEQKEALDYAIDCVKKEIPQSVIVDTSDMDENYNDYNYICPLCNCGIFDENVQFTEEEKNKMQKLEKNIFPFIKINFKRRYLYHHQLPAWLGRIFRSKILSFSFFFAF